MYDSKPATASLHCFWNSSTQSKGARIPQVIYAGHALYDAYRDEIIFMYREVPFDPVPSPEHPDLKFKLATVKRGLSPHWVIERWT